MYLWLLRICSNNLNQYARRANVGGSIYQGEIRDLQVQLEKIWQIAFGTMEALAAITISSLIAGPLFILFGILGVFCLLRQEWMNLAM